MSNTPHKGKHINPKTVTLDAQAAPSTPAAGKGIIYVRNDDNSLHFKDDQGRDWHIGSVPDYKSCPLKTAAAGYYYTHGYYVAPLTSVALTQASPTQNYGDTNQPYGAHAFLVASGAGAASGGTGAVRIRVSGTSINDLAVRTAGDSEVIVADITTMSLNAYYETTKKWIGAITYTLENAPGSTQTTFNATFNYGLAKYEDYGNRDFTVTDFEVVGRAGASDTGFDIELLHHKATGWTYHATAFLPGDTPICKMSTDYVTERQLTNNGRFAYKRAGLSTVVNGDTLEGIVVRITTTSNNAVDNAAVHIGVQFT